MIIIMIVIIIMCMINIYYVYDYYSVNEYDDDYNNDNVYDDDGDNDDYNNLDMMITVIKSTQFIFGESTILTRFYFSQNKINAQRTDKIRTK